MTTVGDVIERVKALIELLMALFKTFFKSDDEAAEEE